MLFRGCYDHPRGSRPAGTVQPVAGSTEDPSGTRTRVVIVDDVRALRYMLRRVLEASGHFSVVGEAGSGGEASDVVSQLQPDLILLDVSMPGGSGIDALPNLRRAAPAARIVVLSKFGSADKAAAAFAAGAAGYIEKGLSGGALAGALNEVLAGTAPVLRQSDRRDDIVLEHDPQSVAEARRFVRSRLDEWGVEDSSVDDATLLASELVTNAVVHAASGFELRLHLTADVIVVEVADMGGRDGMPATIEPESAGPLDESGRGLRMVDAISDEWGTTPTDRGSEVWFAIFERVRQ